MNHFQKKDKISQPQLGAVIDGSETQFTVWAPSRQQVDLILDDQGTVGPMKKDQWGYWQVSVADCGHGRRYRYRLDQTDIRPDPCSFSQPDGVHAASEVIDLKAFNWTDADFKAAPFAAWIIYELHIAAFSKKQSFDGVIDRLDYLSDLGVNAIEILPVASFPGQRNWGYDGVYPFAVQFSYGGAFGLMRLIDACHARGIAVILDVVYNHLGPEGNYFSQYAPYFTSRYHTPWGEAINFDDRYSYGVRHWVLDNVRYWLENFHIDALRLDAVHSIFDQSPTHILQDIQSTVEACSKKLNRPHYLIAESDLNDPRLITDQADGGFGLRAQWSDDFHHSLHAWLTGERQGYYQDFGQPEAVVDAVKKGFVYDGQFSSFRMRCHGHDASRIGRDQMVICLQNHDQTGNRMLGERLSALIAPATLRAAAVLLMTSPGVPLLFMGEEYAETNPFQYFVEHSDARLIHAVREGRKREFEAFGWDQSVPDPQSLKTFEDSCLNWSLVDQKYHATMYALYRRLIALRKAYVDFYQSAESKVDCEWDAENNLFLMTRGCDQKQLKVLVLGSDVPQAVIIPASCSGMHVILDTAAELWGGAGSMVADVLVAGQSLSLQPWQSLILCSSVVDC